MHRFTRNDGFAALAMTNDFFNFSRTELEIFLAQKFDLKPYRATQLFEWVYGSRLEDFSKMSNISKLLQQELAQVFSFPKAQMLQRQVSSDGTRKYLLEVSPGLQVETVMIKQPRRMTLCVSSQVGCAMGCKFCRTGTMGLERNLSAADIVRQVLFVAEDAKNFGDNFTNIVFMGMGEPLHNLRAVKSACATLTDHYGLKIPGRKITVSTVGLVSAIKKFIDEDTKVNLAVSLNATTDEIRSKIMPINDNFSLQELLETLRALPLKPRKRITIEYVMLSGVNDTDADLKRLPKLLKNLPAKVNLIPYNENAGLGFKSPTRERVMRWQNGLVQAGLDATIRWSKGGDISAACGQLALKN